MAACPRCNRIFLTYRGLTSHERFCGNRDGVAHEPEEEYRPIPRREGQERLPPPVDINVYLEAGSEDEYWSDEDIENGYRDLFPGDIVPDDGAVPPPPAIDRIFDYKYCRVQRALHEKTFSLDALIDSRDLESFIDLLPNYSGRDATMASLMHFKKKAGLSRECGNELLALISSFEPAIQVPGDWRTISRHLEKKCEHLEESTLRRTVPWPESFQMHLFNEPGNETPPPVELIGRDLIELIAYKMVCPTTMYINADHVQLSTFAEELSDGEGRNTPCHSDLMTSPWAKFTEAAIHERDPTGIMVPIVTYADGVALGLRSKVCVT